MKKPLSCIGPPHKFLTEIQVEYSIDNHAEHTLNFHSQLGNRISAQKALNDNVLQDKVRQKTLL